MATLPRFLSVVSWRGFERAAPKRSDRVSRSDPDLVRACLDGDGRAWAELVQRYGRLVYSIPLRYGLSEVDADEVMQNVFRILLRELKTLRNRTHLTAWLITVTHHETYCQKARGRQAELEEPPVEEIPLSPDDIRRWERQELMLQALDRLTPLEREIVGTVFSPGPPSGDESAARLDTPRGNITLTRAHCLRKLEAILVEMGIDRDL